MSTFDDWLRRARSSPASFAALVSGGEWLGYEHLLKLDEHLVAAAAGELPRLIVSMPPRHGKSELISRYTPAWFLGRYPDRKVLLASYEARFAASWGRKARDLLEAWGPAVFGVHVSDASAAAEAWEIAGHEGAMATAGVGGPLTGKGAHLLIVDDPVKNAEEAASEVIRSKHWDWWRSTARTRLQKGAAAVIVMTRWHEDDLAGRMLEAAQEGAGDRWEVLELPALCEDPEHDPLGRDAGAALCPQLGFDEQWMADTRRALGSYWFAALYQQRPRPAEGMLFKGADFRYWEPHPTEGGLMLLHDDKGVRTQSLDHCTLFETVDVAASEKQTADFTVISKWAVTPSRDLVLVDRRRQRFEILDVGGFVRSAHLDTTLSSLPDHIGWDGWQCPRASFTDVESFGHGLTVVQELVPQGFPIRKVVPDVDKVSRALVAVARYEEHRVFHPKLARWRREWEDELLAFPTGRNDDQVDTVSMAAARLPQVPVGRARRTGEQKGRTRMGGVRSNPL